MATGLPATVDPIKLADARAHISGKLPVRAMRRLREMCLDAAGEVLVNLHFEHSGEQGLRWIRGTLAVNVNVACQRCLGRMTLAVNAEASMMVVRPGEQSDMLAQESDVLISEKSVSLANLVEDKLLLVIPMHDMTDCPASVHFTALEAKAQKSTGSPFAVLEELRQKER